MIDQLRQALLSNFTGRLKNFQINLKINPKNQSLLILVYNTHNHEKLCRVIDYQFIKWLQPYFKGVFDQPQEIYFHLVNNFNDIVIQENCLSIDYPYGIMKSKRIQITLFKQEVNHKEAIKVETQKIKTEFTQLLREKDLKIHCLKHRYEDGRKALEKYARRTQQLELKLLKPQVEPKDIQKLEGLIESQAQQIKGLKTDPKFLGEYMKKINNSNNSERCDSQHILEKILSENLRDVAIRNHLSLNEQLARESTEKEEIIKKLSVENAEYKKIVTWARNTITELKMALKGQEDKNKEVTQQLQKLRTQSQSKFLKESIPKPERLKQKPERQLPRRCFGNQFANPHKKYFKLVMRSNTLATLTKINSEWHNFVNKYAVPENQILKYYVKLMNVPKNFLMVGFCTQEGLGKCMAPESVYKNCGAIEGETIECIADLVSFQLRWAKEGKRIAETPIPISMRDEPLYLSILLFFEGDEVDIYI